MLISQTTRFAELQSRIHGRVLTEADEAWNASRQTFNLTHDQRPAALVRVANADDVAETVRYAAQRSLRVAPQGTGHNAGPIDGLEDALLLRTDCLQDIEIDIAARRARVGSGVRWGSVADRLAGTGVAGYSLGGGIGWQSRKHGFQSNALTAIEIVTADGELRRIDHDTETDLFWAVRGGGGNYGVVTALEFELFDTPEVYAGALIFPYERGYEVMHAWHEYVSAGMPEELTTWAKLMHFPPIEEIPEPFRGGSFTILQIAYLGNEADGAELIAPLTALGPDISTVAPVDASALSHLAMDPEDPLPYTLAGRTLSDVSSSGIDALVGTAGAVGPDLAMVELRGLGGALHRRTPGHGARGTLGGDYMLVALGGVMDPAAYDHVLGQARRVSETMRPWHAGSHYLNFEETSVDAQVFFDEDAWRTLRALRTHWDPKGVFLANHEIKDS
jgi:FAD/FMN-containing dehydrogenase